MFDTPRGTGRPALGRRVGRGESGAAARVGEPRPRQWLVDSLLYAGWRERRRTELPRVVSWLQLRFVHRRAQAPAGSTAAGVDYIVSDQYELLRYEIDAR